MQAMGNAQNWQGFLNQKHGATQQQPNGNPSKPLG
jgi:hypothetical protein